MVVMKGRWFFNIRQITDIRFKKIRVMIIRFSEHQDKANYKTYETKVKRTILRPKDVQNLC